MDKNPLPVIRLQTHGNFIVSDKDGNETTVNRLAYNKHYHHTSTMRQAFEDIQTPVSYAKGDLCWRLLNKILRARTGTQRMAGWWMDRKTTRRSNKKRG